MKIALALNTPRTVLRPCYAKPGTDMAYGTARCMRMATVPGITVVGDDDQRIYTWYAMSCTAIACAATCQRLRFALSGSVLSMLVMVLS
eukprot:3941379-Rhodomonas_salina.2